MSTKIALAGNPNCGKTTMFNSLTGTVQYVGNWPGVTVEKKEGKVKGKSDLIVTDLPGIYSLSPYTNEEVVSRDYLASGEPAAVIDIVDSTNIERNLYLTTQIMELGKPVVMALNMVDALKKSGDKIDAAKLSEKLGCPVIETVALHGKGVKEIIAAAQKAAEEKLALQKAAIEEKERAADPVGEISLATDRLRRVADEICDNLSSFIDRISESSIAVTIAQPAEEPAAPVAKTDAPERTATEDTKKASFADTESILSFIDGILASNENRKKEEEKEEKGQSLLDDLLPNGLFK